MWGGGRRKEERRGCADTAEEPRPNLGTHQLVLPLPVSTAAHRINIREGPPAGNCLLQIFFQRKLCRGAEILLLYQNKTASGGCWLGRLHCPTAVTTSPKGALLELIQVIFLQIKTVPQKNASYCCSFKYVTSLFGLVIFPQVFFITVPQTTATEGKCLICYVY